MTRFDLLGLPYIIFRENDSGRKQIEVGVKKEELDVKYNFIDILHILF